ncbi:MAG: ATP-binding cassette domain-containing protein [Burkholderiaceae bacterium]
MLGPNGAGKTTILRPCLGHAVPDGGTIRPLGEPVSAARTRSAGVVPQIDNLDPGFSVSEKLLVYGRYFGLDDRVIQSRISALLEFASLSHKQHARILELSSGMKRCLSLARALVNDPEPIFMAEPTIGAGAACVINAACATCVGPPISAMVFLSRVFFPLSQMPPDCKLWSMACRRPRRSRSCGRWCWAAGPSTEYATACCSSPMGSCRITSRCCWRAGVTQVRSRWTRY